ncbi:hypothetical protein C8Q75DRAFT_809611 [Abortiporus biennis]|nr:hypothetical protein C8Q75DRAFT_809611 [Abortiporus biennis]
MVKAEVQSPNTRRTDNSWPSSSAGASLQSFLFVFIIPDGTWSSSSEPSAIKTPHQSQSPSPSLKRPRSNTIPSKMTSLPPIPRLSGEIILEVFSHRSLRFRGAPADEDLEFGDNDRLAAIGEKAFELAVTDALFRKRPMLKATEIETQREELFGNESLETWVTTYKLRDKLRCSPDAAATINTPKETRHLFYSYIGGVYAQNGMKVVQDWIGALVDPTYAAAEPQDVDMDQSYTQSYTSKKAKTEQYTAAAPEPTQVYIPPPPPPANPPPPLPNPLAPAQPHAAFLPLFNQTATQRRMIVEYPATFTGPAHAGKWYVKCVVNGMEKGAGTGASKQLAKEEAARQAYFAMGWAPRAYRIRLEIGG